MADHQSRRDELGSTPKSVVSISLGYGLVESIDDSMETATEAGIVCVAAAGNDDADACFNSPGRSPYAITVGKYPEGSQTRKPCLIQWECLFTLQKISYAWSMRMDYFQGFF